MFADCVMFFIVEHVVNKVFQTSFFIQKKITVDFLY
jgi:hypothetical protein